MNILVTGAKGFVGRNLVENLKNIRDGKNRTRPELHIEEIIEYDVNNTKEELDNACKKADFVFNLAGVNRPKDPDDFIKGNSFFAKELLDNLKKYNNKATVMLSSSIQATLIGRYNGDYGRSKLEGENYFFQYGEETGARVLVYRFPNLVGKWVRPNYNSAVGTFCNAIANDLPYTINDRSTELELCFIDDVIDELLNAMEGKAHTCEFEGLTAVAKDDGKYCYVPVSHKATLGQIVDLLEAFKKQPETLMMPSIPENSFSKKLYSMFLSYLPKEKMVFDLKMNSDSRGSFTEIMKTFDHGQFSVNISKPGITKGQHWHNSKWEFFIVVAGNALIQERKIGTDEVIEFDVSGEKIQAVHMIPGYTHNIINLSKTENLVTLMWANESFDPNHPDTFFESV